MSSDVFVRTRGLGKRFKLYDLPWSRLADGMFGNAKGLEHWALRNVDLDLRCCASASSAATAQASRPCSR